MFDKLDFLEDKYNKLNETIADPAVIADQERWRKLMKEQKDLTPIVEKYKQYKKAKDTIQESKELLSTTLEKDFKELVEMEMEEAKENIVCIFVYTNIVDCLYKLFFDGKKYRLRFG